MKLQMRAETFNNIKIESDHSTDRETQYGEDEWVSWWEFADWNRKNFTSIEVSEWWV